MKCTCLPLPDSQSGAWSTAGFFLSPESPDAQRLSGAPETIQLLSPRTELPERHGSIVGSRINAKLGHLARIRNGACRYPMHVSQVQLRKLTNWPQERHFECADHPVLQLSWLTIPKPCIPGCSHGATALQLQGRGPIFWHATMFTFCELLETGAACFLGRIYRHFSA